MSTKQGLDLKAMIEQAVKDALTQGKTMPIAEKALKTGVVDRIAAQPAPLSFRVSPKGVISIYGLGRFPVSFYENQADRLIAEVGNLKRFVDANRDHPAVKAARANRT